MDRRNAFKYLTVAGLMPLAGTIHASPEPSKAVISDREYWYKLLVRIATPLLESLSKGELKLKMPVECVPGHETSRRSVTYLEGYGRLMAGMAPWLELGTDASPEGEARG